MRVFAVKFQFSHGGCMNAEMLKRRSKTLAIRIIQMVEKLPRSQAADVIGRQLIKAGTSTAANYRSACRARSKPDFINKLGIVEEEADETMFWLEMIQEMEMAGATVVQPLWLEAKELLAIFTSSRITAKRNHPIGN
ncbi:MAG: four helix bundle protein [Bacteroidota bacterium]